MKHEQTILIKEDTQILVNDIIRKGKIKYKVFSYSGSIVDSKLRMINPITGYIEEFKRSDLNGNIIFRKF